MTSVQITNNRYQITTQDGGLNYTITSPTTVVEVEGKAVANITVDSNPAGPQGIPGPASFALVSDSQPQARALGDIWFDDANEVINVYTGTNWVRAGQDDGFF